MARVEHARGVTIERQANGFIVRTHDPRTPAGLVGDVYVANDYNHLELILRELMGPVYVYPNDTLTTTNFCDDVEIVFE